MKKIFLLTFLLFNITNLFSQSWSEITEAFASDKAVGDGYGNSVAISGVYAVVGAPSESEDAAGENSLSYAGSAYIYKYNGSDWVQQQKIVASDREVDDSFGNSVSISGDYIIVGAVFKAGSGAAYIFVRSGETWTQQQKIVALDNATNDDFGSSVSISGDYAIVGAPWESEDADGNNSLSSAGSAYIFKYNGSSWVQQQKIVASDREVDDRFGISVSISGDYAIVGADREAEDANGNSTLLYAGSAYIFVRSSETWTQQQKIVASDRAYGMGFGCSVSISGDDAIIGAEDEGAGSAYVFVRDVSGWTQQQKIVPSDRDLAIQDYFGCSVSISGNYAIIGAEVDEKDALGVDNTEMYSAGSAYIFLRSGLTWTEQQKIVASDRTSDDYFGCSVAISGNYIIVGANQDRDGGTGAAYIYGNIEELPVELTSFAATAQSNTVTLNWQTATEVNNYCFEIERMILKQVQNDGQNWEKIGFVEGHGNSNSLKEYSFVDTDKPNRTAKYRLKQIDSDGKFEYSREVEVQIETPTVFALQQNYPNPFNPNTNIQYSVATTRNVSLKVYDVLGNEVATLVNEEKQPGVYNYELGSATGGRNCELTSGVYFYQLRAGNFVQTKKMIVLK
ncbi:MAG: T9SS type A sorting domain-containing protein [Ignavibacteriaceae bacterium]|jgi:hypothetical protein